MGDLDKAGPQDIAKREFDTVFRLEADRIRQARRAGIIGFALGQPEPAFGLAERRETERGRANQAACCFENR